MEVAALAVSVPWATGVRIRSTESAGSTGVIAGSAGAAGVVAGSARAAGMVAGSARATGMVARSARATGTAGVITRPAGAARVTGSTGRRSARTTGAAGVITGAAGTTRATGTAGAARIVGTGGRVATTRRRRPAMITRRLWRPGSSVGKPGAHSQGRSAERAGDGHPSDKLLQLHDASPIR